MQGGSGWLSLPLCIAPHLLLFKVWVMLNAAMVLTQENGADEAQYSVKLIKKNYIYGNTTHKVDVYVKVHKNSPFLVCMDLTLSQSDVVDPSYLWIGPDGQNLKGANNVNLTATGKLMVLNFKERMSGSYTCTLTYRMIRADMQEELERFKTYKFMVYAYREPDYTYRISVHYTTKDCNLAANKQFFLELIKILNNLISYLTCHIIEPAYRCYSVKRPQQRLEDELFVIFQVNPFAPGWETICHMLANDCEDVTNNRVQKARWLIEEFFLKQEYILMHEFQNVPAIHYIDHSFQVTRLDSCHPGFGKDVVTHGDCANCCVACNPGTYSPSYEVVCQPCTNIRIQYYGATSC
ncbi:zona pellucida-binding protein 2 isoform X2 [Hemicordylus capensis]|uniref:zona pellucida-binding protein 2 isoform X2 n=1 Tax=Hemicordylus capensis TaxID=884348 RepID=UPI002302BAB3|nr:zona pellucida-binding protein 2 isoform X2 [Hemicordylus capensis]